MSFMLDSEKFKDTADGQTYLKRNGNLEKKIPDFHKKDPFAGFSYDKKIKKKLQRKYTTDDIFDKKRLITRTENGNTKGKQVIRKEETISINRAMKNYSEDKVTSQTLRGLTDWLCENFEFVYIEGKALYIYEGYLRLFSYSYALRFLTQTLHDYDINFPLRTTDCKEIVRMLQAQPQITRKQDNCRTNVDRILFSDGAFDPRTQTMCTPKLEDFQFSKIEYPLQWGRFCEASPEARSFIQRFCDYDERREDYLWELVGYLLSSYQQKILVVFLGPSNSGKSTLANMIRRICGSESCVALGIKELAGNFSLAELQGKRLCIDSEMDASVLNAKDISLLKKVVGNDLLQGNRKHEQQFYFQCQTKFLICSNNKIKFNSDEDAVSFLNRIKVFELHESIPVDEQRYDMEDILDENRTYFLQKAMEGLCRLVANNFEFSCEEFPEDFVENINRQADVKSIEEFVTIYCRCDEEDTEKVSDLYAAYRQFTSDCEKEAVSNKRFTEFLVDNFDVVTKRTKTYRYYKGIKMVTDDR